MAEGLGAWEGGSQVLAAGWSNSLLGSSSSVLREQVAQEAGLEPPLFLLVNGRKSSCSFHAEPVGPGPAEEAEWPLRVMQTIEGPSQEAHGGAVVSSSTCEGLHQCFWLLPDPLPQVRVSLGSFQRGCERHSCTPGDHLGVMGGRPLSRSKLFRPPVQCSGSWHGWCLVSL